MGNVFGERLLKLGVVGLLVAGVTAFGLMNVFAQDDARQPQTYMVMAGGHYFGNTEALAFAPQNLQVHRGDTVMWHIAGFHDIRFGESPVEFVLVSDLNGQPTPQVNPIVGFPSIENGAVYSGGEAGSGLPGEEATFSLVIDLEPGTYAYFCDVHPGMLGTITVVEDDVEIPSPTEAIAQGNAELDGIFAAAMPVAMEATQSASAVVENGTLEISAGIGGTGRATVNEFPLPIGVIQAGQSVTWVNPADGIEPHSITSPQFQGEDVIPVIQEGAPPVLTIGPGLLGTTPSGTEVAPGDVFHSGLFNPGQSFTLTFNEPGVYSYLCWIHPGMTGVIIVEPAA